MLGVTVLILSFVEWVCALGKLFEVFDFKSSFRFYGDCRRLYHFFDTDYAISYMEGFSGHKGEFLVLFENCKNRV
jgi:hypothetical protein